jgi:PAS domain S-box-containing protein
MQSKPRFFSRILLPSMIAVLLFLIAIYLFVIPNYRESLMDGKRETIRELTSTAWSVMHKLDLMVNDNFDTEKAQREACLIIGDMRWGEELKDYFWITDTIPTMVMHPYRPSMNGMDLSDYKDQRGKNFFVDIVNIVKTNGDGYVDYKWQWKDDSLTVVSKLSYVKEYEPWGWIVGTGIYIDDVNRQIEKLTQKVVWISALITILIGAIITYLARRNYVAESERQKVQERLRDSLERYKKLVEASTDGVLMMIDNEIVYCNPYLLSLLGYSQQEFDEHNSLFHNTINNFLQQVLSSLGGEEGNKHPEISMEQKIMKKNGVMVDVVVNRSKFEMEGKKGFIFAVKDVSKHKDVERELDLSMEKFKSIAGLMNIGIFRCTLGRQSRFVEINPKALALLGYKNENELRDTKVQDLFDISEEKKEVIRAINEGITIKDRLLRLKRADGSILPTLVSLFPVADAHGKMVYCDGMLIDAYDHLSRDTDFEKNPSTLHLSASVLLQPINEFLLSAPHCDMKTSVNAASKLLTNSKSDVLLVVEDNSIIGLITHSDISRRVIAAGKDISISVSEIMSAPVFAVSDEDMVMDAFTLMVQNKVSYIVVKSNQQKKYSYISLLSLSELRKDTPEYLINSIQKADSVYEVTQIINQFPRLIRNLVETGTGIVTTSKLVSRISDSITEKYINEAIAELGTPPAPFAFLALGSEGRREQTLATDQDNAIVFNPKNELDEEICKSYFLRLGERVCTSLNHIGYPLCKGGVMAMNSEWCKSLSEWQRTISGWVAVPNPQEILNISIFFDFRPVYGDFELANQLQKYCQKVLKDQSVFFFNLAQTTINLKVNPIESVKENDGYDIKMPILAITSIARLWSLKFGLGERNTPERLMALNSLGVVSDALREEFDQAFRFLMLTRFKNQLTQYNNNEDLSNKVNSKSFSDIERLMIKKITSTINDHQNKLAIEFRVI